MTSLVRLAAASLTLLAIPACLPGDDAPPPTESPTKVFQPGDPASIRLAEELALKHLATAAPELAGTLSVRKVEIDDYGYAFARVAQTVSGIPVFGREALVKLGPTGEVAGKVDKLVRDIRVDTTPRIDAQRAVQLAAGSEGMALQSVKANSDLMILLGHGKDRLVHRIQLDYWEDGQPHRPVVFVDAKTGEVVWKYDNLQTAKNRELHNLNHGTSLPGPTVRVEGGAATGDVDVDTNYDLLGWTYDCYKNMYNRDSFDNAGAKLISSVHYSNNYVNAFWNGTQMVYGDGDGVYSISLAISMDVTAHELTHAVTEYTSNLIYAGESGGLNESMSDIFGNVCEWYRDNNGNTSGPTNPNNYLVGDEIWLPEPALRYMHDPFLDGISLDFWSSTAGNVDVHYSSGISNLAFYLLAEGGTHPRGKSTQVVTGIGINDAAAIFYRANAMYLMPNSTFGDARVATVDAATDLFGANSAQVAQTKNAWTAVNVMDPPDYVVIDTKTGLSSSSTSLNYSYPTNGATAMKFVISGGTGDADLYVRFGSAPTPTQWDCRPYAAGNNETCEFNPAQSGTYYVMLVPFTPFTGVTLTVSAAYPGPATETSCNDGVDNDGDGQIDCADGDCAMDPACLPQTETSCDDGVDNDNDGQIDCADGDCAMDPVCQAPDWVVISNTTFETGMGPWTLGGEDASRVRSANHANNSLYSIRIRDDSGAAASFRLTNGMDLTGKTQLRVQYSMIARGMEVGESYRVELQINGGSWQNIGAFVSGSDFLNDVRQAHDIQINLPGTTGVRVRFRNIGSTDNDAVYIDDVVISAK